MGPVSIKPVAFHPSVSGSGIERGAEKGPVIQKKGPDFKQALLLQTPRSAPAPVDVQAGPSLKFSNHAVDRMRLRGVQFGADQLQKIEQAVQKASAKGARETLILTDESALIVNIKSNVVVTVMDKNSLKENVFTNIDSTVVI